MGISTLRLCRIASFVMCSAVILNCALPSTSCAGWFIDLRVTDILARTSPSGGRNIAFGPDGKLNLVYNAMLEGNYEICYRQLEDAGWSERERLTFDSGGSSGECIATHGEHIHVFWHDYRDGNWEIYYKRFDGASWGPDERLTSADGISGNPSAACDDSGYVHVVWHDDRDGDHQVFYKKFGGMSWSADAQLTDSTGDSRYPSVAVGPDGMVHVVWRDARDGNDEIYYKVRNGDSWSEDTRLTDDASSSEDACIVVDGLGVAHVVWSDERSGSDEIYYKRRDHSGWSVEERLTTSQNAAKHPSIAVGDSGHIHVTWRDTDTGTAQIYYMVYDGTFWSEAQCLSEAKGDVRNPSIATDRDGCAHVVWNQNYSGTYGVAWTREFEGDIPDLEIWSIEPSSWFSNETVHITDIAGSGFVYPVRAWLERDGESDLEARNILVHSSDSITCDIRLGNAALGGWDLILRNAYRQTDTLVSAIEVLPARLWSDATRLTDAPGGSYTSAGRCIDCDPSGNLHAVWMDERDGIRQVYYTHCDESGWFPAERLTHSSGNTWEPAVATDAMGRVHVVWYEHRTTNYEIFYKCYDGSAWGKDERLTRDPGMSLYPAVAADDSARVHVVWSDGRNGRYDIYYKRFDGVAWSEDTRLSDSQSYETHPCLDVTPAGDIHVAWQRQCPSGNEIYCKVCEGGVWGPDERRSGEPGDSREPSLCVGPDGRVHLVWIDARDVDDLAIYYKSKDAAGWSPETEIMSTYADIFNPSIAVGGDGCAYVVWEDRHMPFHQPIEHAIYCMVNSGGGWGDAERVTTSAGKAEMPSVAVHPMGSVHVIWQDDRWGDREICCSCWLPTVGPPPTINCFYPARAPNTFNITADIFGTGFRLGCSVWLEKAGESDKIAYSVELMSSTHIKCGFRLNNAVPGQWDLHLKNPDLQKTVLLDAITTYETPWGVEKRVSSDPAASLTGRNNCRSVSRQANGVVHVVWHDRRDGNYEIYYRRWDGNAWEAETRLTTDTWISRDASIVLGPDGRLHLCWNDSRDGSWEVYYKCFDGESWSEDELLSPADSVDSEFPCLTVDTEGNPFVFYDDNRYGHWEVFCVRWGGTDWIEEERITNIGVNSRYATAASDSLGNTYVFWSDRREGDFHIYYDVYDGESWSGNQRMPCEPGQLVTATCACDNSGRVMVVWRDDFYTCKLLGMIKDGEAWTDVGVIALWDKLPNLCGDGKGRFHLVYEDYGGNTILHRIYSDAWSAVTEVSPVKEAAKPSVAADAHGRVAIVWTDGRDEETEVYMRTWEGDVDAAAVTESGFAELGFGVHRVAPNPVSDRAEIVFGLTSAGSARVMVFDVSGRLVWKQEIDGCEQGDHRVIWNCRNLSGNAVSPGVYIVRLGSGPKTSTAKMVVLR
ncbi:MAG: T9SS type A sorting domain-containing protein [Candidatus Eisenbacteria bacterium]